MDRNERATENDAEPGMIARAEERSDALPALPRDPFLETTRFVFLDPERRLRAGFRVLAHGVVLALALVLAILAAVSVLATGAQFGWLDREEPSLEAALATQAFTTFAATAVAVVLSALVLDAQWKSQPRLGALAGAGLDPTPRRMVFELSWGLAVAALAMAVTAGLMSAGGMKAEVPGMNAGETFRWTAIGVVLLVAAAFEELLFRGYLYQWLGGSLARLGHWALAATGAPSSKLAAAVDVVAFGAPAMGLSVLFGLVHLSNPAATWLSATSAGLAGLWFVVLLVRTRSLWPAIAAHWAWNALTLLVLGLPVSGIGEESGVAVPALIDLEATGPRWISGGDYGPEGSVASLVGVGVAIIVSALLPRRSPEAGCAAMRRLSEATPNAVTVASSESQRVPSSR